MFSTSCKNRSVQRSRPPNAYLQRSRKTVYNDTQMILPRNALNAHVESSRLKPTSRAYLEGLRQGPTSRAYLERSPTRPLTSKAYVEGWRQGPTLWACVVGAGPGRGTSRSDFQRLLCNRLSLVSIWFYVSNKCVPKNNYNKC